MSHPAAPRPVSAPLTVPTISVGAIVPWLAFSVLLFIVALFFVGAEEGATSLLNGTVVHEWVHDGRHLLGFPCH